METDKIPMLGFGTYNGESDENAKKMYDATRAALKSGYRRFNTAERYASLPFVGNALFEAIASGEVTRADLFISTKLNGGLPSGEFKDVEEQTKKVLRQLKVDKVDLLSIHYVFSSDDGCFEFNEDLVRAAWKNMIRLRDESKLCERIGVSNFYQRHIEFLLKEFPDDKPFSNEIETNPMLAFFCSMSFYVFFCVDRSVKFENNARCHFHPRNGKVQETDYVKFLKDNDIAIIAASPLMWGHHQKDRMPVSDEIQSSLDEIAKKHDMTWAQVALAWNINRGVSVVPRSTQDARIEENFEASVKCSQVDVSGLPVSDSDPQNSELAQLARML